MQCSVIISSSNRASSLEKTLNAFGRVFVPAGCQAELLVVDNASTDDTARVVRSFKSKNFTVRYIHEERPGKSYALNTGLAASCGEVILFTDDDVVPAEDWLEKMMRPLLQRECDGVVGRTELARHLLRPWMKPVHKLWLVAPDNPSDEAVELIGANMGVHRSVFRRIREFDPELGPGKTGFGEETLLSWQMNEAGFQLKRIPEALVVHHPDASRLLRSQWIASARKRGKTAAYILHHWHHANLKNIFMRQYYVFAKLIARRLVESLPPLDGEGSPPWEMSYITEIELSRQFRLERKRPRNYSLHGLQKVA